MILTSVVIRAFFISLFSTFLLIYPIKKMAVKIGIMDFPNQRKINKEPIPRIGGLGIVLGTIVGLLFLQPNHEHMIVITFGAMLIVVTGFLDDKYALKPIYKLIGQLVPTLILIGVGVRIESITVPFIGIIDLNIFFSTIITLIWIIGITNAINLIDGLDGLASGVSTIALISILVMAILDERILVVYLCIALIGSNIGFLIHNFYPAKIFMGDTGSLFLGYSIAVISILGVFKKVTLLSFVIPVIVLALPIFDTLFAIIRRLLNGEKIMHPDKKHIHHQLISAGYSHRTTVLIMYCIGAIFGILAILFSRASLGVLLILSLIVCLMIYVLAEIVGLIGNGRKPILDYFRRLFRY